MCVLSRLIFLSQEEPSPLAKEKELFKPTLNKDGTLYLSLLWQLAVFCACSSHLY